MYQVDGHAIVTCPYVTVVGVVDDREEHKAFLVKRVFPYRPALLEGRVALPVGCADYLVG